MQPYTILPVISIYAVLSILFIHWYADFVAQTDKQATNKSSSIKYLLEHTLTYSLVWLVAGFVLSSKYFLYGMNIPIEKLFYFVGITFAAHTVTDFFTSKLNAHLWENKKIHSFFVSIGFDQYLHYLQLLLTYYFLI